MEDPSLELPQWVRKRDGRLVPFEADRISRALFAATETLGKPDAFLARELADGVIHFLREERDDGPLPSVQIAEVVVKVVRELGHPHLADIFGQHADRRVEARQHPPGSAADSPGPAEIAIRLPRDIAIDSFGPACWRAYSLQAVFTRDLAAAQDAGLLSLGGLEHPGQLAGCVLSPPFPGGSLTAAVEAYRFLVGRFLVLDGPEYYLAANPGLKAEDFAAELARCVDLTGLQAIVNLNCRTPPSWADDLAGGPLFAGQGRTQENDKQGVDAGRLADLLTLPSVRINWHVDEQDLQPESERWELLLRLIERARQGVGPAFVLDRPRRRVVLDTGVTREHPALLMEVALDLQQLGRQAGIDGDATRLLNKLGSLTRLALSAGVQKRAFLRQLERSRPPQRDLPRVTSGFLLERARILAAPLWLEGLVVSLSSKSLDAGGSGLELARKVLLRIREVLREDGRAAQVEGCVDGSCGFPLGSGGPLPSASRQEAGKPAWGPPTGWKQAMRAAHVLQGAVEHGSLGLLSLRGTFPTAQEIAGWLSMAWHRTEIVRIQLHVLHEAAPSGG